MNAQIEPTVTPEDATTQEHETLAEALLAAQKQMPAVEPDSTNPHFKSKFVSLGNLLAKVRPVLNRHGLALVQCPSITDSGAFVLQTKILHSSGESLSFDSPLTPTKNDPQAQGSAITYMRRYALGAALAIADQEDDDGNASDAGAAPFAPANEKQINVLGSALNWLLPPDVSASVWDVVKAQGGGEVSGPVANALIAVIKARKDVGAPESTEAEQAREQQDRDGTQPDVPPVEPSDLPPPDARGLAGA